MKHVHTGRHTTHLHWFRDGFDGGGGHAPLVVDKQTQSLAHAQGTAVEERREAIIVAACIAAIVIMSTALVWVLAVSLEAPRMF